MSCPVNIYACFIDFQKKCLILLVVIYFNLSSTKLVSMENKKKQVFTLYTRHLHVFK